MTTATQMANSFLRYRKPLKSAPKAGRMDKTPRATTRLHPVSDGRTQNQIEPGLFRRLLQRRTSHRSGKGKRPLHPSSGGRYIRM